LKFNKLQPSRFGTPVALLHLEKIVESILKGKLEMSQQILNLMASPINQTGYMKAVTTRRLIGKELAFYRDDSQNIRAGAALDRAGALQAGGEYNRAASGEPAARPLTGLAAPR
jgi:hypothetical protein